MVKLATVEDIPGINAILNHPEVYRWATMGVDMGTLNIEPGFKNLFTIMVEDGKGCIILDPYSIETMEVHTCLLPSSRGASSEEIVRGVLRFAFAETGCQEILTKVPRENKAADLFTRQTGFVRISDALEVRSYVFPIERWPHLDETLDAFCPPEFTEIQDPHYRRVMGAMVLMSMKGFMGKAVSVYNKHARLHGFPPMGINGMDSVAVGGRAIHFEGDSYKVEDLCQPQPLPEQAS